MSGNIPTLKDQLINGESQKEKNNFSDFKMKTGILFGPLDFFMSKSSIILSTSPGTVGERKNEDLEGLISTFPFTSFLLK